MENPSTSKEKRFYFPEIPTEEINGNWVENFISQEQEEEKEEMFTTSTSTDLMNFESFASWCNNIPSSTTTEILLTQYGLSSSSSADDFQDQTPSFHGGKRSVHEANSQFYCLSDTEMLTGKRIKGHSSEYTSSSGAIACNVSRSLSYSLDEKMLKALSLFMEFSGEEGVLAQFWTPIKTGDSYMLSTSDQAYLLDSRLSGYREVSRNFTFSAEANQCSSYPPGLPGRVFISGVPEWTSNVMYYKTAEYLRMKYALDNEVRGSIAIPVLESSESSCCGVLELVTWMEKPNFDLEMDSVCRALQAVNLQTSTTARPRRQYLSSNQKEVLAEIRDIFRAVCHAHRLPLALVWIPCTANDESVKVYGRRNSEKCSLLCIEETGCYVNDMEMEGFVNACSEHYLREGQGVVGKAMISNKPSFSTDVKLFDISEYPLVQHARKYGLNAAVATKLRSTFTGDDVYILEFFLPLSMKGSAEQQLLLDSLSGTMQRICRTLRTVSDVESNEVLERRFDTTLMDIDVNSSRSIFSNMSVDKTSDLVSSQGNLQQRFGEARRTEKRKSSTEKNVSLDVLQKYFSGSLKDAAKSLGVCPTTLKRICRQHGIMRWPSRKINKVNRSLKKIQTVLDSVQGVEGGLKFDSVTGEFIAVCPFNQTNSSSRNDDSFVRRSQEDVNEEGLRPLMEPWGSWISKQSGLNYSDDFDIGKRSDEEVKQDKELRVRRCLSSLAFGEDAENKRIERGNTNSEPNPSMSSSMSDSSHGSGAVLRGSNSSNSQDYNQTRTYNNSTDESISTLTVKATYRDDTIRFKLDTNVVGCSQLYKEVGKRFKLQEGTFQLKYLDDDEEWVMLVTDSDFYECLEILNGMRKHTVKFLVRELTGAVAAMGSSGGSNVYFGTGS